MLRRHRVRRVAKWAALIAAVVTLLLWAVSVFAFVRICGAQTTVSLADGILHFSSFDGSASDLQEYKSTKSPVDIGLHWNLPMWRTGGSFGAALGLSELPSTWTFTESFGAGRSVVHRAILVPIWTPFATFAAAAVLLFRIGRRLPF